MKFLTSFTLQYDPCGIISEMRVKNKNAPYAHEPRTEIEKFANQTEWEPDTLVDVEPTVGMERQVPSTSAPPTTTPQNPKEKRPWQESSSSVTEVSPEEFKTHTKKPRTVPTTGTTVEQEITTTTVATTGVKPASSPLGSSQHKEVAKALKSTDSPTDAPPSKTGPKLGMPDSYYQHLCLVPEAVVHSSTQASFNV
jgi:hypothetical protein